jgi:hypothetical protein
MLAISPYAAIDTGEIAQPIALSARIPSHDANLAENGRRKCEQSHNRRRDLEAHLMSRSGDCR